METPFDTSAAEPARAKAELILSVALFGTIGVFVRFLPLPSGVIAFGRGVIGTLFLLLLVFLRGKRPSLSSIRKNLPTLCLSGALIGANWILLFEAYRYTTVAVATLCYYLAPVFVILASPLLFRERLSLGKLLCVAAALLGMVFVSGVLQAGSGAFRPAGILLGLGAAVCYACIVLLNKRLTDITVTDRTIVQLGVSAIVVLPYVLLGCDLSTLAFSPRTILLLVTVGILHTGVAYALYFGSISRLKAQSVALFSYIDPIIAILLSALLLRERLDALGVFGAVLILGSTAASELLEIKKRTR